MTEARDTTAKISAPPPRAGRRRWPLLAIGASAGTATWSGWVGLGELTGFGVVHPLPGIWDDLAVNTAVTLPIGVEAYAMYALSVATSSRPLAPQVRRYAWASSAGALLLGMAGQVGYHVMSAHQIGRAPWWVTALVSCLPVLVLGAASLLWHYAGHDDPPPDHMATPDPVPLAADPILATAHAARPEIPGVRPNRPVLAARSTSGASARSLSAREDDLHRARAAIASGDLPAQPTAAALRTRLAISPAYARATRDALRDPPHPDTSNAKPHPQQPIHEIPGQERIALFTDQQQHTQAPTPALNEEKPRRNDQELHTYAVDLT